MGREESNTSSFRCTTRGASFFPPLSSYQDEQPTVLLPALRSGCQLKGVMDFTPLYLLDSPSNLHVSPGSTFLLSVAESRTLLVRSAATLSLVRSWTLPPSHPPIEHTAWSPDGAYFLAASFSAGRVDVFVLDPRRQPEEGAILPDGEEREEDVGAVAVVKSGAMKMTGAAWAPAGGPPTIFTFAADEVRQSLFGG